MNSNQIMNMVTRIFLRRFINFGMKTGMEFVAGQGGIKGQPQGGGQKKKLTPEQREAKQKVRQARQARRLARQAGKF
ncbi:hypothetical protein [Primorskyibacter sp. S87]|uniref:hypothetical protein n=1 Tax=Primorskyibacter sp. S87 TaxID=3415126 RepID=UPI003C7E6253